MPVHISRKSFLFFFLLLASAGGFAQSAKYSNEFLTIGVGARGLAMGNAFVASVNDVTSGYWNPAGLANQGSELQIGLMHAGFFAGLSKYDYLGISKGVKDNEYLGFSLIRVGVDDIPNTIDLMDSEGNIDYERIRRFSVADYGFLFSYARKIGPEGFSVGGNAKIIHRRVGEFANAWGFGLDAGLMFVRNDWKFGVIARDVTSTFNVWSFNEEKLEITILDSTFNKAPDNYLELTLPSITTGISRLFIIHEKFSLQAEIDLFITFDGERATLISSNITSIEPSLGLEMGYLKMIYVRMGIGKFQKIPVFNGKSTYTFQPGLGLGIRLNRLVVDYSLTNFAHQGVSMYSNIFSILYTFNKQADE